MEAQLTYNAGQPAPSSLGMKLVLLTICTLSILLTVSAEAFELTHGKSTYQLKTVRGSFGQLKKLLIMQPWWNDCGLATQAAGSVKLGLGQVTSKNPLFASEGPRFACKLGDQGELEGSHWVEIAPGGPIYAKNPGLVMGFGDREPSKTEGFWVIVDDQQDKSNDAN